MCSRKKKAKKSVVKRSDYLIFHYKMLYCLNANQKWPVFHQLFQKVDMICCSFLLISQMFVPLTIPHLSINFSNECCHSINTCKDGTNVCLFLFIQFLTSCNVFFMCIFCSNKKNLKRPLIMSLVVFKRVCLVLSWYLQRLLTFFISHALKAFNTYYFASILFILFIFNANLLIFRI